MFMLSKKIPPTSKKVQILHVTCSSQKNPQYNKFRIFKLYTFHSVICTPKQFCRKFVKHNFRKESKLEGSATVPDLFEVILLHRSKNCNQKCIGKNMFYPCLTYMCMWVCAVSTKKTLTDILGDWAAHICQFGNYIALFEEKKFFSYNSKN